MEKINPIKGLTIAVEHPNIGLTCSKSKIQQQYWNRLKEQRELCFDDLCHILISSLMNFEIAQDCARLIVDRQLLKNHEFELHYMSFINDVMFKATNYNERISLSKERSL